MTTDILDRLRAELDRGTTAPTDAVLADAVAEIERLRGERERRRYVLEPDTVESPRTVGDIRRAIEPLSDDAQAFIAISGHGEDYAIAEVDMSKQVDDADYLVFGLEIHLGLFPERPEARAER